MSSSARPRTTRKTRPSGSGHPARPLRAPGGRANTGASLSSEEARQSIQENLLNQIAQGAKLCHEVEREFGDNPAPELETVIKLHRLMILKLSAEAHVKPQLLSHVHSLTKSALDWARLEEKRKDRELAEQKYRDELDAQKAARQKEQAPADGLRPETLTKIERELNLF